MTSPKILKRVVILGTWPPHECGLAAFASDLIRSVRKAYPTLQIDVLAVTPQGKSYTYDPYVAQMPVKEKFLDYIKAVDYINHLSDETVVCVQHEFGIYGGNNGSFILGFLKLCHKPTVTVIHNPLVSGLPNLWLGERLQLLEEIIKSSTLSLVFGRNIESALIQNGLAAASKLRVVPHGIPDYMFKSEIKPISELANTKFNPAIGSWGIFHIRKGYEYLILSLNNILKVYPGAGLIIAGKTGKTPREIAYINFLHGLIQVEGLTDRVKIIPRFLSEEEVIFFFKTIDIFTSPYTILEHGSSGTLTFAMATKKAIISTPYIYARELLAHNRGLLIPFSDSKSIQEAVVYLIQNKTKKAEMERNAYQYSLALKWSKIPKLYVQVFEEAMRGYHEDST